MAAPRPAGQIRYSRLILDIGSFAEVLLNSTYSHEITTVRERSF